MTTFIEQELKDLEDVDTSPHFIRQRTWRTIFCSKLFKGIVIAFAVAVLIPTLAYFFVISSNVPNHDTSEHYSCLIREEFRIPCGVSGISSIDCIQLDCCYNASTKQCHHFLPSKYYYTPQDDGTYLTSEDVSPIKTESLKYLKFTIQNKTGSKLSLILHNPDESVDSKSIENPYYSIMQYTKKLIVEIFDQDGDSIFSTAKGALIASERYWEWSFQLSNGTLFGLDRNLIQLDSNETLTKVIYKSKADHTTLPVFWAYQNGKFHGAVIRHDGPMEIQILSSNMVILRSLVGKRIEIELSLGPTPEDLYRDQTEGMVLPPLWALGTHNCRKGDTMNLTEILEIYKANNDSSFDTDCIHENLFMALQNSSESVDLDALKMVIQDAKSVGKKFLLSLPPHILIDDSNSLYKSAKELNLLFKYETGVIYNGTYLDQGVVYPDYSAKSIDTYVQTLISWIDSTIGLESISGLVLNDNWPQDDGYSNVDSAGLPYFTIAIENQMKYTLPWILKGTDKLLHLEKHNEYGQFQNSSLHVYLNSLISEEPLIISSTKMYGNTEPEISDNFDTSWGNFRTYLNRILFNSITGNRMVGLPVCGDTGSYNKTLHETLCIRWYIAAATMPYFRVSSGDAFRDPTNLNTKFATIAAETAMTRRSLLQDHLFTILSKTEPVVRPMFYHYFDDIRTFSMESQYTIGKDIIVAHPFSSGEIKLQVYLPEQRGIWYEFWGGTMFNPQQNNEYVGIDTFETDWVMLVAQGTIVALTQSTEIQLYIALDCSLETGCIAQGDLLKDGNMLSFSATDIAVTISDLPPDCAYSLVSLRVYGYENDIGYVHPYVNKTNLCGSGIDSIVINYYEYL